MSQAAFDAISASYDHEFTYSLIGRYQKGRVLQLLDQALHNFSNPAILELNCGTGEDAVALAKKGCKVLATDISPEMVQITQKKVDSLSLAEQIQTQVLDINELAKFHNPAPFDVILSNFGGMNCIDTHQYKSFVKQADSRLSSGGKLIVILMARYCLWEFLYFAATFNKKCFRRLSGPGSLATIGGHLFSVWYPSVKTICKFSKAHFQLKKVRPVGLLIPPTYLEALFQNHLRCFSLLAKAENKLQNISFLGNFSDHVYLEFDRLT